MNYTKRGFLVVARRLGVPNNMESMTPEDRLRVAEHIISLASDDFKMPKLKLKTGDISKIGLIKVDGRMITIEELKELKEVKGSLNLSGIGLTELPDLSHLKVEGGFNCRDNTLTSLQGAPQKVGGDFNCHNNKLTSLQGAPKEVGGDFWCSRNNLTSLQGAPQEVGGDFWCSDNNLTSLQGAPKEVGGDFWCSDNETKFTEDEVRKVSQVSGKIYL